MTQHVRTWWHRIVPAVDAGEVYLTAPRGGHSARAADYGLDPDRLRSVVQQFGECPHFVVERELVDLATEHDYYLSMRDMRRAGVLHMPYPAALVEWPVRGADAHTMVLVRDLGQKVRQSWEPEDDWELSVPFYGIVLRVHRDQMGDYMVVSPSIVGLDLREESDGRLGVGMTATGSDILPMTAQLNELIGRTYTKDGAAAWFALCAGTLLVSTHGVEREVVEVDRLNKKRRELGREPVPRHTYIRIGRVYRTYEGERSDEYVPRRSPRPHWRRGHVRTVRHGAGREKLKQIFVPGRIVAYAGEGPEPARPEYTVV